MFGCPYAYVGLAGKVSDWGEVVSWFADPEQDVPRIKGVEFLLLSSKGQLYHGSSLKQWMKLEEPFFSIGSGMDYAMGAMATGKDPLEAVKVAAKFDPMTGMGFQQFKIKEI